MVVCRVSPYRLGLKGFESGVIWIRADRLCDKATCMNIVASLPSGEASGILAIDSNEHFLSNPTIQASLVSDEGRKTYWLCCDRRLAEYSAKKNCHRQDLLPLQHHELPNSIM
jgi:hypothetical protein